MSQKFLLKCYQIDVDAIASVLAGVRSDGNIQIAFHCSQLSDEELKSGTPELRAVHGIKDGYATTTIHLRRESAVALHQLLWRVLNESGSVREPE